MSKAFHNNRDISFKQMGLTYDNFVINKLSSKNFFIIPLLKYSNFYYP